MGRSGFRESHLSSSSLFSSSILLSLVLKLPHSFLFFSPEQHGTITGVMKTQIDWIPLATGSVRPTQGRTLAVSQVNGGSQSFNTVNTLRILGRWVGAPSVSLVSR